MPEVILPCPACGGDCLIVAKNYPSGKWHTYCDCGQIGRLYPTREEAIKAHNALPRAMTWTHEPPKVAHVGRWFWSEIPGQSMPVPVIVVELDGVLGIGRGTSEQGLTMETCHAFGVKFAGPIPAPID